MRVLNARGGKFAATGSSHAASVYLVVLQSSASMIGIVRGSYPLGSKNRTSHKSHGLTIDQANTFCRTLETLSQQLEECRSILKRLYPNQDLASLAPLSRQELLSRLEQPSTPEPLPSPPLNNSAVKHETGASQIPDFAPEFFDQTASSLGSERGHGSHFKVPLHDDIDDMNTQKTALDRDLESLGPTSIKAALMVMLKVRPQVKSSLVPNLHNIEITSNIPLIRQRPMVSKESPRPIWSWKDQTSLEAYFKRIHPLIPMLDENSFRSDYLQGRRNDSPWLSLLNMMLALGSIASTKSNDLSHTNFYNRAMEHITIESFASSSIETVQALAMIGGVYLHYINRSHMANAVMGAAIRMASSLGLHRDLPYQSGEDATTTESRRRTWWSLFCLDTWATTSMGRPSFGRFGPAMMMPRPEFNTTQVCHEPLPPRIESD